MFIGHYGPAVWDTRRGHAVPIIKLWEAFLAVQAMDLLTGVLGIFGIEGMQMADGKPIFYIPWSHSLISSIVIAALAGLIYKLCRRNSGQREFMIIAVLAFSHWVLDLVVHRPDLPIYPGGELLLGFALWDFPWTAFALEAGLLAAAFWFWQKVTVAKSKLYDYAIWALFVFMVAMHFIFIVNPGLQVQAGTFDMNATMPGNVFGALLVFTILLLAFFISRIERGRPSKFSAQ